MNNMRLFFALLISFLLNISIAFAQAENSSSLIPDLPKAFGQSHPEGNEFWRINHPRLLKKDRDLALREGERDIDASLKTCVACHVVFDEEKTPVTYQSEEYFCRVCHDYVAVKIDCFSCHNSLPDRKLLSQLFDEAIKSKDVSDDKFDLLKNYLEEAPK